MITTLLSNQIIKYLAIERNINLQCTVVFSFVIDILYLYNSGNSFKPNIVIKSSEQLKIISLLHVVIRIYVMCMAISM